MGNGRGRKRKKPKPGLGAVDFDPVEISLDHAMGRLPRQWRCPMRTQAWLRHFVWRLKRQTHTPHQWIR